MSEERELGMRKGKKAGDGSSYEWRRSPIIPRAVRPSSYISSSEKAPKGRKTMEGADRL